MADRGGINGTSILVVLVGSVLAYSGLKGKRFSVVARDLLAGQNPQASATDAGLSINTGGGSGASSLSSVPADGSKGATIVAAAQAQIGKPYLWATPVYFTDPNPQSFDCSGLVGWCYQHAGISLTHFTGAQYLQLPHRPYEQAQPGDVIFFSSGGAIYHDAIYIGDGRMIEAAESGIPVRVNTVPSTNRMRMVGYPR